jgi:DNA helicase-2/ATP-dependent DNA helicase PcrA
MLTEKQAEIYKDELAEIKPTLKKYATTQEKQEKHIKKLEELYEIFSEYNATLRYLNKYDFSDMINFVLEKIGSDNELKSHYAEQFQFIMLDEYQDTNNAQNMIIDEVLSVTDESPNIMTV